MKRFSLTTVFALVVLFTAATALGTSSVHIDDREFEIDSHGYALTTTSTGTVKWFDSSKGFGFIVPDDGGNDLFVHHSEIKTTGDPILDEGQKVEFEVAQGRKGPCATNVVPG